MDEPTDGKDLRAAVRDLCGHFPSAYWRKQDADRSYPEEFIQALTAAGWLAALIPEMYGGGGLGIWEAAIILEEINRTGGDASAGHAQLYIVGMLLRHGSEEQKRQYLPDIASGRLRLQSFAVTEPDAGSDTTSISTFAERQGDHYVVNGRKIWTSRVPHSDYLLLLARTTPRQAVRQKTDGLSVFLVDLRTCGGNLTASPIQTMINHETSELAFDNLKVPLANRIGEEGKGFRYILSGLNAERILVGSEQLGWGYFFIDRASRYASERIVFDRPIGQNQGIQFPIAKAFMNLEAARLMRNHAARLYDSGATDGTAANMCKYLTSEAAWEAANVAMTVFGGNGFATEYDIERCFRETRLGLIAPVSNNMILAFVGEHVLDLPRSY